MQKRPELRAWQWLACWVLLAAVAGPCWCQQPDTTAEPLAPPTELVTADHPYDGGDKIDVTFKLSVDDPARVEHYRIGRSVEPNGLYDEVGRIHPTEKDRERGTVTHSVEQCVREQPYYFRVVAVTASDELSPYVQSAEPVAASRQWIDSERIWFGVIMSVICLAVVSFILIARMGVPLRIRKIAGLEAVDEAVGRATEMGRSCLFIPGIQDMNDIQTVAGITILSRVAKVAAEYDAKVEVPTARALVMTAARETVQAAYLAAGRPDAFNQDLIYYVTDEQFGYVAYLSGMMVREKPAACFFMGSFYAESLILAETGNQIGAIQVAGTAMPSQLPFFVAACDYTLIGEEFFAASAYLSGEPDQLGSLKGQDVGKVIVALFLLVGCFLATAAAIPSGYQERAKEAVEYLQDTMLK